MVGAAGAEPGAVLQENYVFRMHAGLEFFDAPGVHDGRAVDAEKNLGIQGLFQGVHRHVKQMARPPAVQLDIVLGGLHPVYVLDFDEEEKQHKYTISSSLVHFMHGGKSFTIIDKALEITDAAVA